MKLVGIFVVTLFTITLLGCGKKETSLSKKLSGTEQNPEKLGTKFSFEEYAKICEGILGKAPEVNCDVEAGEAVYPYLARGNEVSSCLTAPWSMRADCNKKTVARTINTTGPRGNAVIWHTACRVVSNASNDKVAGVIGTDVTTG